MTLQEVKKEMDQFISVLVDTKRRGYEVSPGVLPGEKTLRKWRRVISQEASK